MSPAVHLAACVALALAVAGCGSDGSGANVYAEGDDEPSGSTSNALDDRWQAPATSQTGSYQDGPPWDGGKACAGALQPGARARGDQIGAKFGIAKVEGYACRPNTANKSQLSMHGTGRALDIFVTPEQGDTVANYIATNANALGFQLVIWNRTLWKVTEGGGASRAYTGPNPHTDHVHAELTIDAASAAGGDLPADDGTAAPTADPATDPTADPAADPTADPQTDPAPGGAPPQDPQSGASSSGSADPGANTGCTRTVPCPASTVCVNNYCL